MSVPGPIITGTIVYLLLGAALMAVIMGARITGMMSKDNAA
jgi:mannose/fructose/N-acetylgalactosamine-specific phosphotransferase system component IIC